MDQDIRFLPAHAIGRLLRPASVAIIGASDKPGALGASVLANLDRLRFPGEVFLVNPNRAEIGGRACLKAIGDLPEGVDVAILAIPRASVLEAVNALALRKTGAAVIFSAGFAEGGRTLPFADVLQKRAISPDMPGQPNSPSMPRARLAPARIARTPKMPSVLSRP